MAVPLTCPVDPARGNLPKGSEWSQRRAAGAVITECLLVTMRCVLPKEAATGHWGFRLAEYQYGTQKFFYLCVSMTLFK